MRSSRVSIVALAIVSSIVLTVPAGAQGTKADYVRARDLPQRFRGKVTHATVKPHWLPGSDRFWFKSDLGNDTCEYILVDADQGTRKPLFDHAALAKAISESSGKRVEANKLALLGLRDLGSGKLGFSTASDAKAWTWDASAGVLSLATASDQAGADADGTIRLTNRVHRSRRTGERTVVTFINERDDEVKLQWVDTDGVRRDYGSVPAHGKHDQGTFAGHVWVIVDTDGKDVGVAEAPDEPGVVRLTPGMVVKREPPREEPPPDRTPPKPSHAGEWSAVVRDHDVYLRPSAGGDDVRLTQGGSEDNGYTGELHWSPDSSHFVAIKRRKGGDRRVTYIESSPTDQLQPKTHWYDYLKPGDPIPQESIHLFNVATRKEVAVSDELWKTPWDLSEFRWSSDSSRFMFIYNERGHRVMRVLAVDAQTGTVTPIVNEECKTFFDYAGKMFARFLDGTNELIWMSERDGWNHLYLYDTKAGVLKNQITKGEWVVRGVDRVDEQARQIWFRAGGIRPGQDPYYIHVARVNFDGTGLTVLTEGDGTHKVEMSPDNRYLLDTYSRVDQPPITELRRADTGSLVCEVERADASALVSAGWRAPERFVAKGRDGTTDIYGVIVKPTNFDPSKKYPVIEQIYAGPQDSFTPKSFRAEMGTMAEIAELGFIVVQMDGMGTSNRSKAFHDVCWKNLGDAGFPDRIAWIKAAAAGRPEIDLTRVGIYGGSAGGQNAMRALIDHGDFYKAAVADCGCHDNRMDKIWWNELWMSYPVGPEYEAASNVVNAHKMQGKLMLVVGEMDQNVDPASTMQVVNALEKADKDFELLVVTGAGHGACESPYGRRRRQDFFVRNLLHVEPRAMGLK